MWVSVQMHPADSGYYHGYPSHVQPLPLPRRASFSSSLSSSSNHSSSSCRSPSSTRSFSPRTSPDPLTASLHPRPTLEYFKSLCSSSRTSLTPVSTWKDLNLSLEDIPATRSTSPKRARKHLLGRSCSLRTSFERRRASVDDVKASFDRIQFDDLNAHCEAPEARLSSLRTSHPPLQKSKDLVTRSSSLRTSLRTLSSSSTRTPTTARPENQDLQPHSSSKRSRIPRGTEQLKNAVTVSPTVALTSSSSLRDVHLRPSSSSRHCSSGSRTGSAVRPSSSRHSQSQNQQTLPIMGREPDRTERMPTAQAPIGDPTRTILEGFETIRCRERGSRQENSRNERNSRPTTSQHSSSRQPRTATAAAPQRAEARPPIPSGPPPAYTTHAPRTPPYRGAAASGTANRNQRRQNARRPDGIAAPAEASPQTMIHMDGRGTQPPQYMNQANFPDLDREHGVERPPAYQTTAPTIPLAAQWIPRRLLGEDARDMRMEGRRDRGGPRNTMHPSTR